MTEHRGRARRRPGETAHLTTLSTPLRAQGLEAPGWLSSDDSYLLPPQDNGNVTVPPGTVTTGPEDRIRVAVLLRWGTFRRDPWVVDHRAPGGIRSDASIDHARSTRRRRPRRRAGARSGCSRRDRRAAGRIGWTGSAGARDGFAGAAPVACRVRAVRAASTARYGQPRAAGPN